MLIARVAFPDKHQSNEYSEVAYIRFGSKLQHCLQLHTTCQALFALTESQHTSTGIGIGQAHLQHLVASTSLYVRLSRHSSVLTVQASPKPANNAYEQPPLRSVLSCDCQCCTCAGLVFSLIHSVLVTLTKWRCYMVLQNLRMAHDSGSFLKANSEMAGVESS